VPVNGELRARVLGNGGKIVALPDSLITASAGLIGAGIGGTSTYLASRGQWRRESRRTVYASLISAAYEMEAFLKSTLQGAGEPNTETSADADPRMEFSLQLDSASLLAKGNTQEKLELWRQLLDDPDTLAERSSQEFLGRWQDQRRVFSQHARDELGAPGMVRHRRRAVRCCIAAGVTMIGFVTALQTSHSDGSFDPGGSTLLKSIGYTLFVVTIALLSFAFLATLNWRITHPKLKQSGSTQKAIGRQLVFIAVAFGLSAVALLLNGSVIAVILVGLAAFILITGAALTAAHDRV
jgi:hypothetical protein